ncbi:MAG TPA: FkbM family methyltransferase [Caulifigura sp.]|jgi:FkbM family methyltransferase|nr:FkbM family methyltransferase [Caulifigura sp.]
MDGSGPLVAENPRAGDVAPREVAGAPESPGFQTKNELIRRLLTPAQYWKHRLIPGAVYGWARSMRQWRRGEAELRILEALVDPHRTAVDVGANKGTYTWFLSRLCRHVYAYEPNPAMRWMLTRSMPQNVTIFPRALSDHSGEAVLRIPAKSRRFSNNIGTLRPAFEDLPCELVPVRTSRLDDDGLVDVGFLKIDVEGHEQEVLRGAREIMTRDRPVLLIEIIEDHNDRPVDETIDSVERLGYRAHVVQGTQLTEWAEVRDIRAHKARQGESNPRIRNYVFLPAAVPVSRAA